MKKFFMILLSSILIMCLFGCVPGEYPPLPDTPTAVGKASSALAGYASPDGKFSLGTNNIILSDSTPIYKLSMKVDYDAFVYQYGYIFYQGKWNRYQFDQSPYKYSQWIDGAASTSFEINTDDFYPGTYYALAYACKKVDNEWQCNDNQWMIQKFTVSYNSENSCYDKVDNDNDGMTDCQDPDCNYNTCGDGLNCIDNECSKELPPFTPSLPGETTKYLIEENIGDFTYQESYTLYDDFCPITKLWDCSRYEGMYDYSTDEIWGSNVYIKINTDSFDNNDYISGYQDWLSNDEEWDEANIGGNNFYVYADEYGDRINYIVFWYSDNVEILVHFNGVYKRADDDSLEMLMESYLEKYPSDLVFEIEEPLYGQLSQYPNQFFKNGEFNGQIVIGDDASASQVISAVDIITSLQFIVDNEGMRSPISPPKLASSIRGQEKTQNLILIGNPCHNEASGVITGWPWVDGHPQYGNDKCGNGLVEGVGGLKFYINGDYVALLVNGYSDNEIRVAASVLANYNDYNLNGDQMCIYGSSLSDFELSECTQVNICPSVYEPVCGRVWERLECEGCPSISHQETFENECVAQMRDAEILYDGVCEAQTNTTNEKPICDTILEKETKVYNIGGKDYEIMVDMLGQSYFGNANLIYVNGQTQGIMRSSIFGIGDLEIEIVNVLDNEAGDVYSQDLLELCMRRTQNFHTITSPKCVIDDYIFEGEIKNYNVNGRNVEVESLLVSDDSYNTLLVVDGQLTEGLFPTKEFILDSGMSVSSQGVITDDYYSQRDMTRICIRDDDLIPSRDKRICDYFVEGQSESVILDGNTYELDLRIAGTSQNGPAVLMAVNGDVYRVMDEGKKYAYPFMNIEIVEVHLNEFGEPQEDLVKLCVESSTSVPQLPVFGCDDNWIYEGEDINFNNYYVENIIVTDHGDIVTQFKINGEVTDKLDIDSTYTLQDGSILKINGILANDDGAPRDIVNYCIINDLDYEQYTFIERDWQTINVDGRNYEVGVQISDDYDGGILLNVNGEISPKLYSGDSFFGGNAEFTILSYLDDFYNDMVEIEVKNSNNNQVFSHCENEALLFENQGRFFTFDGKDVVIELNSFNDDSVKLNINGEMTDYLSEKTGQTRGGVDIFIQDIYRDADGPGAVVICPKVSSNIIQEEPSKPVDTKIAIAGIPDATLYLNTYVELQFRELDENGDAIFFVNGENQGIGKEGDSIHFLLTDVVVNIYDLGINNNGQEYMEYTVRDYVDITQNNYNIYYNDNNVIMPPIYPSFGGAPIENLECYDWYATHFDNLRDSLEQQDPYSGSIGLKYDNTFECQDEVRACIDSSELSLQSCTPNENDNYQLCHYKENINLLNCVSLSIACGEKFHLTRCGLI